VVSGGSCEMGVPYRGVLIDHCGPMEDIFANGIAHAVAGMSRKEANKIVLALLAKYEDKIPDPPTGKPYPEYYDATARPNKECIALYREMRKEMSDEFGLKFKKTSPYG